MNTGNVYDMVAALTSVFGLHSHALHCRKPLRLCTNAGWRSLRAVRAGRVYVADGNKHFNRSGPRITHSMGALYIDQCCGLPCHSALAACTKVSRTGFYNTVIDM